MSSKDSVLETIAASNKDSNQGSQLGNASDAEVPVTIHASRYSAAAKGAAKLPPIHEETRTVIIFPQGAVVRLSATVTVGELVVLTNKRTGEDVVCRVTSVKTQPGVQNYAHLEFTQRAIDFWQEASAEERSAASKPPLVAASSKAVPLAPIADPIAEETTYNAPAPVQHSGNPLKNEPPMQAQAPPAALPEIMPLAGGRAKSFDDPVAAMAAELKASEPKRASASVPKQASPKASTPKPSPLPAATMRLQPFESAIPQKSSNRTVALFAVAAVVLLTACGIGATVLLRNDHGASLAQYLPNGLASASSPAAPAATTAPAAPAPATAPAHKQLEAPIFTSSVPANVSEPPSTASRVRPSPEPAVAKIPTATLSPVRASIEPAKPEPEPQPAPRTILNVGKLTAPRVKTAARLNSSEPPSALPPDVSLPPAVTSDSAVNPLAQVAPVIPPKPVLSAPVQGGKLQQPKLLSSTAAVYPSLARNQHLQGDVVIDALIDATGKVVQTKVVNGNVLLQQAAMDALRLWKYQPATLNGQPIPIHLNVTISFHLN